MNHDAVIVGSGINALVCGALLARGGWRVCVLERNDRPGGCIRTDALTLPGYIHDTLSNWHPLFVTSPGYAELRAELERHGLQYCNTDAPTAAVLPDGRHFVLRRSRDDNARALDALSPGDGARYRAAMAGLERRLDLTFTLLGSRLWSLATLRAVGSALWRRGIGDFLEYAGEGLESCRAWLERDLRSEEARACFAPWPPHGGYSPDGALSGMMARVIAFTLEVAGCPVVKGGSFELVRALQAIIESRGGVIHTGADVTGIVVSGGRATGVRTADGRDFAAARAVIASVTPQALYGLLLPEAVVPPALREQAAGFRFGRGGMQIHLALSRPPQWHDPALAGVAMVHLTPGLDGVTRAIAEADSGLLPVQGTIVVGQPAALDPSRVPDGAGLLWVQLQEVPGHLKGDAAGEIAVPADGRWTDEVRERYADRIVARIARHVPGLRDSILKRVVLSPADIERLNCNLVGGDPYAGACTLDQSFLWRPLRGTRNHSTPVAGLHHIGASTHPGPGLGGGSGYLVAKQLCG